MSYSVQDIIKEARKISACIPFIGTVGYDEDIHSKFSGPCKLQPSDLVNGVEEEGFKVLFLKFYTSYTSFVFEHPDKCFLQEQFQCTLYYPYGEPLTIEVKLV